MGIRGKIMAVITAPIYLAVFIVSALIIVLLRLIFLIMNFIGLTDAIIFWLNTTRTILVKWEFRRGLSKEDRAVMNSKE